MTINDIGAFSVQLHPGKMHRPFDRENDFESTAFLPKRNVAKPQDSFTSGMAYTAAVGEHVNVFLIVYYGIMGT